MEILLRVDSLRDICAERAFFASMPRNPSICQTRSAERFCSLQSNEEKGKCEKEKEQTSRQLWKDN
jgi:hypothetical protein